MVHYGKNILKKLIDQTEDDDFIADLIDEVERVTQHRKPSAIQSYKALEAEKQEIEAKFKKIISIISYELGSPLNSLKSMAELLMLDMSHIQNDMLVNTGEYLTAQIDALQAKMNNAIQWANLENKNYIYTPEGIDFERLINNSVRLFYELARKKAIEILIECEEEVCVTADKNMLEVIMLNLISNAIKYSKKGDTVLIRAEPAPDECLKISVIDTGIGMGTAKLQKIYDIGRPPQRGTANEHGLGLGLIVVRKMLELHQKTLHIESQRGAGSTFSFLLPMIIVDDDIEFL